MDAESILADVMVALNIGNMLLNTVEQAVPWFVQAYQIGSGALVLSDAQRAANLAAESALTARLDAPSLPQDQA